jgi:Tfp pilus assembly protein PilX
MVISYSKILFSLLFLLLVGCAGVPVQEMSDARQAVEAAKRAGAENNASQELSAAEALLQKAEEALSEGDYAEARKAAEAARDKAVSAQDKASPQ